MKAFLSYAHIHTHALSLVLSMKFFDKIVLHWTFAMFQHKSGNSMIIIIIMNNWLAFFKKLFFNRKKRSFCFEFRMLHLVIILNYLLGCINHNNFKQNKKPSNCPKNANFSWIKLLVSNCIYWFFLFFGIAFTYFTIFMIWALFYLNFPPSFFALLFFVTI